MKRFLMLTLMFCSMAVIAAAQPPAPMPEMDDEPEWSEDAPMMEKLELTADQKKNMRALAMQNRKEMIPLRAALQTKQLDLQTEMQADQANLAKINALVDDMAKLRADVQKKQIAHRLKMRDMLTPQQREIWEAQKGKRMREFGREGRHGRAGMECRGIRGPKAPRGPGF